MEHKKIFKSEQIFIKRLNKEITIEGPVPAAELLKMELDNTLDAFRNPKEQHAALVEIADLPEGRIIVARVDQLIVGYVTFHYPDPLERWSEANMDDLIELGAIEVSDHYRNCGLGKLMIRLAFSEGQLDNVIVYTTEYYWHWDLEGSKLSIWDYRKMMEKLMQTVDMIWYATDDPEICAHPANCLMVKIGPLVPLTSVEKFDRIRFQNRFMY